MTILHITNTGKLNYHLKSLGSLVGKDEEGKYCLTGRGKLAATVLKTFPEKVKVEKNKRRAKIAAATLLILLGVALVSFAFVFFVAVFVAAPVGGVNSSTATFSNEAIPQNTSIFLNMWAVLDSGKFKIAWSASNPVYVDVLNATQEEQQYGGFVENFTGTPHLYVGQYYSQNGSVSVVLPEGQYYLFVGSSSQATLDSLAITQQLPRITNASFPPSVVILITSVLIALGIILVALGVFIFRRRL